MKTIGSIIQQRLNRMLLVSLGTAAALLLVYSAFSFKQTESQAVNFVMNHVAAVAKAGVNSQNVTEIDREIGRFTHTWKEAENLDLRVDVYLDDRQIGHAGPLQPFRHFSSGAEEKLKLPSGEELKVVVQVSLTNFLLFGLALLTCFGIFITGLFYVLKRSIQKSILDVTGPLESRIAWLKTMTEALPQSARELDHIEISGVRELDDLGQSIQALSRQIVALEAHLSEASFNHWRIKLADQVAHNVQGIIATLQLRIRAAQINSKDRQDLLASVDSLRDVSSNLLASRRGEKAKQSTVQSIAGPTHILSVLRTITSSYQSKFQRRGLAFNGYDEAAAYGAFCAISPGEIESVLSNLLNNAIEAIEGPGTITLDVKLSQSRTEIEISDSGKGIPEHILPRLTEEGFTYGKPNGNGIGLFHARQIVETVGGTLQIRSDLKNGTSVCLSIPKASAPSDFVSEIAIVEGMTLIFVDDDPLIHQTWKMRVNGLGDAVNPVHLSSVSEFKRWFEMEGPGQLGSRLYLFDYDLKCEANGLDLISQHGVALESILVSGVARTEAVKRRCREINVRAIPKEDLIFVPIQILARETEIPFSCSGPINVNLTKGEPA